MDEIDNHDQLMMDQDGQAEGFTTAATDTKIEFDDGGHPNESDIDEVKDILNKVSITGVNETGNQDQSQSKIETDDQVEDPKTTSNPEQIDSKIEGAEGGSADGNDIGDVRDILTYEQLRKLFLRPQEPAYSPESIYASDPPEISDILEDDFYSFAGPVMLFTESGTPPRLYD